MSRALLQKTWFHDHDIIAESSAASQWFSHQSKETRHQNDNPPNNIARPFWNLSYILISSIMPFYFLAVKGWVSGVTEKVAHVELLGGSKKSGVGKLMDLGDVHSVNDLMSKKALPIKKISFKEEKKKADQHEKVVPSVGELLRMEMNKAPKGEALAVTMKRCQKIHKELKAAEQKNKKVSQRRRKEEETEKKKKVVSNKIIKKNNGVIIGGTTRAQQEKEDERGNLRISLLYLPSFSFFF